MHGAEAGHSAATAGSNAAPSATTSATLAASLAVLAASPAPLSCEDDVPHAQSDASESAIVKNHRDEVNIEHPYTQRFDAVTTDRVRRQALSSRAARVAVRSIMSSLRRSVLASAIVFALAACAPAHPPNDAAVGDGALSDASEARDAVAVDAPTLTNAYIARACSTGPGYSLEVLLTNNIDPTTCMANQARPSTQLVIGELAAAPMAGVTITSTEATSLGIILKSPGATGTTRVSRNWSVTFDSFDEMGSAAGRYTVTWPEGDTESVTFRAMRCETGRRTCR